MGGHGGLNILPQKRWNVYRFDNIEKVRKDEEAAAQEEQLAREQSRRRDSELRLESLRRARNPNSNPNPNSTSDHINLFQNFPEEKKKKDEEPAKDKKRKREEKEKERPVITKEDEKYKLGYGLIGRGVKLPWYAARPMLADEETDGDHAKESGSGKEKSRKKSIEELREERMKREKKERDREAELIKGKKNKEKGFSRRRM